MIVFMEVCSPLIVFIHSLNVTLLHQWLPSVPAGLFFFRSQWSRGSYKDKMCRRCKYANSWVTMHAWLHTHTHTHTHTLTTTHTHRPLSIWWAESRGGKEIRKKEEDLKWAWKIKVQETNHSWFSLLNQNGPCTFKSEAETINTPP